MPLSKGGGTPGDATRERPYELARFEILGSGGLAALAADLGASAL